MIDKKREIWLDNARITAALGVIFLHSSADVVVSNPIGSINWWISNFYDSLVRWSVPFFVMISGALLLEPNRQESLTVFYRKRLSRIMIPTLFWSVFYLIIRTIVNKGAYNYMAIIINILTGKPYFHMWFLYMIMLLYMFTPFFRKVVKQSTKKEMIFLIICSFFISVINKIAELLGMKHTMIFTNLFLPYIPYYFLGYFIRTNDIKIKRHILVSFFFGAVLLTALGCYFMSKFKGLLFGLYFYDYLSITVIPMSVSLFMVFKSLNIAILSKNILIKLSYLTFGCYLIHPIFLGIIEKYIFFNPFIAIPFISIIVFSLSLFVSFLIYQIKYFRRVI